MTKMVVLHRAEEEEGKIQKWRRRFWEEVLGGGLGRRSEGSDRRF